MNTKEQVLSTVEKMKDEIVSLLSELVRIPSVNPRYPGADYAALVGGESACNERLAQAYRIAGCQVDFVEKEKGRANLVGVFKGSGGGRSLIYNGHIDTVPVGNASDWKWQGPFSGKVEGGKLYGRGSTDMKRGIVAQLKGIEPVWRNCLTLKGDTILETVGGEEPMAHGVGTSAVCEKYKADAAI